MSKAIQNGQQPNCGYLKFQGLIPSKNHQCSLKIECIFLRFTKDSEFFYQERFELTKNKPMYYVFYVMSPTLHLLHTTITFLPYLLLTGTINAQQMQFKKLHKIESINTYIRLLNTSMCFPISKSKVLLHSVPTSKFHKLKCKIVDEHNVRNSTEELHYPFFSNKFFN